MFLAIIQFHFNKIVQNSATFALQFLAFALLDLLQIPVFQYLWK